MSLLGPNEPPAYTLITNHVDPGPQPMVLSCEHASNTIPAALRNLGLELDALNRHIAIDLGAQALTRRLAEILGVPALFAGYSRLVVDLNRYPTHAGFVPPVSDGQHVPGNQRLSTANIDERRVALFSPYHDALAEQLRRSDSIAVNAVATSTPTPLISVHSFTPALSSQASVQRPWDVGILWVDDDRLSRAMISQLRNYKDLCVGVNQPYNGKEPLGFTPHYHGELTGRPYLMIEVRQDLIGDDMGVARWADILSRCIERSLVEQS